jgi:TraX protein
MNIAAAEKVERAVKEGLPIAPRHPRLVFSDSALSAAKWLALVLMVVDHTNKYVFDSSQAWMFALGRLSMPLFAFVLGYNLARPGMLESGGFRRVAFRLALFGLVATLPFVVINKLPGGWWPLNMMFTLLVGVLTVWLIEIKKTWATVLACLVTIWGGGLVEYWWPAIGVMLSVWAYRRGPSKALIVGFVVSLAALYFVNGNSWALAVVPVLGLLQRWTMPLPRVSWLFYAVYPLHLAVFWWWMMH